MCFVLCAPLFTGYLGLLGLFGVFWELMGMGLRGDITIIGNCVCFCTYNTLRGAWEREIKSGFMLK